MPARSRSRPRFAGWFAAPDQAWFVWPPPPPPPKPKPPKRTPKPKPVPVRAPAPPPAKARAKPRGRSLPPDVREILDDRLEAELLAGGIDLIDDGEDLAERVEITLGEFNRLRKILLREDFAALQPASRPTSHPPGSAGKIAELERRAEAGESLTHRHDADPLADDRRGIDVSGTGRGANLKTEVHGWDDE